MAFRIHRVGPSQWRQLREIRLRALSDAPYAFGSTFEAESDWDDHRWEASVEQLAWFIASGGREPVGLIAGLRQEDADQACRAVISMWVDPRCRGTGTAQALFAGLADWAVQDGARWLTLHVADTNERARRFYDRLGFTPTGARKPLPSDPTTSSVEMQLALRRARLRFAPSPAGDLHVGHVRTAVLTWIMAQQLHGEYFVRFENTDRAKEVPGSMASMVADLQWLGLLGEKEPRHQADMTDAHRVALERLGSEGHTYRDGGAVRFRTPSEGTIEWDDFIRGRIGVRNHDLDDPVLVRSSGTPTFYLASTVDDTSDGVTHLVRAEPLRPSTAKQIHIWRSLGTEPPGVGHVPLVTGAGNSPLQMGATSFTIRALRERGISPVAMLMYLAMPETASWKPPPPGLKEIIQRIDLRRLPRRPITFDVQALQRLHRRLQGGVMGADR